jgi:hypothetical protein
LDYILVISRTAAVLYRVNCFYKNIKNAKGTSPTPSNLTASNVQSTDLEKGVTTGTDNDNKKSGYRFSGISKNSHKGGGGLGLNSMFSATRVVSYLINSKKKKTSHTPQSNKFITNYRYYFSSAKLMKIKNPTRSMMKSSRFL